MIESLSGGGRANDSPHVESDSRCAREGGESAGRAGPKLVTNEGKRVFSWDILSGQFHKSGLGKEWCDSGPRGKGWLGGERRAATSLAPTNLLSFLPPEHVLRCKCCTNAVSYFLSFPS